MTDMNPADTSTGDPLTNVTPVPPSTLVYGWLCPACGRGNTPTNATCPCKPWPTYPVTCGGIVGIQGGGTIS